MPSFLINSNTDKLLKRDHDNFRGRGPSPIMEAAGLGHLRPFSHPDLELWTDSLHFGASPNHFNTIHEETNIKFGGGLDDVFENPETGELHIVDYKSTAQASDEPKPLDETFIAAPENPKDKDYKLSYRRQMDAYQWIMRRKGFQVSDVGYFIYVDGQHIGEKGMLDDDEPFQAWMRFNAAVIPYVGDDSWVEGALVRALEVVKMPHCPPHSGDCETGAWLEKVFEATR